MDASSLPSKALQEMQHISQLLNTQARLAQILPLATTIASKTGSVLKPPQMKKPDVEIIELNDMDVASPQSDDELYMSFSPPPLRDTPDQPERRKGDDDLLSAAELDKHQKVCLCTCILC